MIKLQKIVNYLVLLVFIAVNICFNHASIASAASVPDPGVYTFIQATQNADRTATTKDGFFVIDLSDGSGRNLNVRADEYGAYIDDYEQEPTGNVYSSYLEVRVADKGSFSISTATIGEYNVDGNSGTNDFTDVYLAGFANDTQICETPKVSSVENYETEYDIDYTDCKNKTIDMFRVFYTVPTNGVQADFNLINFTLASASNESVPNDTIPVMGGTVSIAGTAKFGETLTAGLSGVTYTPNTSADSPTYQWKRDGAAISGATASSYTLAQADIGAVITVTVSADGTHATGSVTSLGTTTAVERADGPPAPAAPALDSKTTNSLTVTAITGQEYSIDNGVNWQDSPTFSGLTPSTSYTIIARVKQTATQNASAASQGASFTTDAVPVIVFISAATADFAENQSGTVYTAEATGTGTVTYSITGGDDQAKFAIDSSTGALTFIGVPNFEQPSDADVNNVYEVAITATDSNGSAVQNVSITVTDINDVSFSTDDNGDITYDEDTGNYSLTKSVTAGNTANITFKTDGWLNIDDVGDHDGSPGGMYGLSEDGSKVTIVAEDGYTFDLSSFKYAADTQSAIQPVHDIQISFTSGGVAYNDSYSVNQDPLRGYSIINTFDHPVNDVSQVTIKAVGYVELQDFEITDIKEAPAETTPAATIDYASEKLKNLKSGASYTVNSVSQTADGNGELAIDSSWLGATLSIVKIGNGTTTTDSAAQTLAVPSRPSAPTGVGKTDETAVGAKNGTITSVTSEMEYRASGDAAWAAITDTSVTGLEPGTYVVRTKATLASFASAEASVTIGAATPVLVTGVTLDQPTLNLTAGGATATLTATVTPSDATNKDVTWSSSDTSVATVANGVVTPVSAGTATITVTTVDGSHTAMSAVTVTAAPATTTTTVTAAPNPADEGTPVTLTATVSAASGTPTGTVSFSNGATVLGTAPVVGGKATLTTTPPSGTHTITATYSGDTNFTGSTGTTTVTVNAVPAATTTTVTAAPNPADEGTPVTLTATVSAATGTPTGTVSFSNGATVLGTAPVVGGIATLTTTPPSGTHTITATYSGDANFTGSTGTTTVTVNAAPVVTTTVVTATPNPSDEGAPVTLTATVSAATGTPSGDVVFTGPNGLNETVALVDGQASVTTNALTSGTVTVTYGGNASFAGSSSTTTVTVNPAPATTTTTVTATPDPSDEGTLVTLTATVSAASGTPTGGTVSFSGNDTVIGTVPVVGGIATFTTTPPSGVHTVTATYSGDTSFAGSTSSPITVTVNAAPTLEATTTTVTAAPNPSEEGTPVTLTATVTQAAVGFAPMGIGTPSGTVTFKDGSTVLGTGTISGGTASFTTNTLSAGTHSITAIYSGDTDFSGSTGTLTQVVNLPNAPSNPQNLVATGGDRQVTLTWDSVTGATYYNLYLSTISGEFTNDPVAESVTGTTYNIQNLTNGTTYHFVVKAGNLGGLSAASNQSEATPATVPAAPTNVSAVAGNGQATISFTAPVDNGGSSITGYEVTASSGDKVTGVASPIIITGLINGTSHTFTVKAINRVGSSEPSAVSNAVIPRSPSSNNDNSSSPSQPTAPSTPETTNSGVDVLVNGKVENAGTATTTTVNDQSVTTIAVDQKKLEDKLAAEGQGAVVTIPVNTKSDVVVGELNGQMVKNMETKQAVLEIKTEKASYTLPAEQINISAISDQIGKTVALQDIKVQIEIATPPADTVKVVENAAAKGTFSLVVPPVNFTVTATHDGTTVELAKFNAYVERTIAIPEGIDPNKITTGVVVDPDGTVRHVPTKVTLIDGKYYAVINSLTNSTYSVVWHPIEFKDVANHWSKNAVNDMGSRMVIEGIGNGMFSPDTDITRAEFAAIIVRGLGLKLENGAVPFSDIKLTDWYSSAINTAYDYHLISGFEDGTFRPNDKITREQAMVIISKAMTITKLKDKLAVQASADILHPFTDANEVSDWAAKSIANSVETGIVTGRNGAELAPKAFITRAEVAAIVERLLKKSELI